MNPRTSFRVFVAGVLIASGLLGATGCSGSSEREPTPMPTPDIGAIASAATAACIGWVNNDQIASNNQSEQKDIQQTCTDILRNTADSEGWPRSTQDSLLIAEAIVTQAGHGLNSYAGGQRAEDLSKQIIENAPAK